MEALRDEVLARSCELFSSQTYKASSCGGTHIAHVCVDDVHMYVCR